jgi:HEPN domain-containing protein
MSPEGERAAEVREWLEKAMLDVRGARLDLAAVPPLIEDALFHSQQIAEKVLKAFLVWHDVVIRKTHSIEELGDAACKIEPALGPLVDEAVPLTEYAWAFR